MSHSKNRAIALVPNILFALLVCLTPVSAQAILYAPAMDDDPTFRESLAGYTDTTVDYFDTRLGTPSASFLSDYEMVITLSADEQHASPIAWGNRLADFADAGGSVVLPGDIDGLTGRIVDAEYSPVWDDGSFGAITPGIWDGTQKTRLFNYAREYRASIREGVALRPDAMTDGTFTDGDFVVAYRPDMRVVYLNGISELVDAHYAGSGDCELIIGNVYHARDTKRVLVYDMSYDHTVYNTAVYMGCAVTRVETAADFVVEASSGDGWDVIAVEAPGGLFDTTTAAVLSSARDFGVPILLQYWNLGGSGTVAADLRDLFGVANTSELTTPTPVHGWTTSHPVWSDPIDLTTIPTDTETWFDNGDRLTPQIGAAGIAGFSSIPSVWNAAIVVANNGHSLVNGFAFDEMDPGAARDLVRNELKFLLHRSETLILSTSAKNMAARAAEVRGMDTTVAYSVDTFALELNYTGWDTIIVDAPSQFLSSETFGKLDAFVADGGRLHLSYWSLSSGSAAALRSTLEIADVSSYTEVSNLYEWDHFPPGIIGTWYIPTLLWPGEVDAWVINGQRLEPTANGRAMRGFTSGPTASQAATIVANNGFTFVNGFDYDSYDPAVMLKLVQNQIGYLGYATEESFIRGDCNRDDVRNIADPLFLLSYLNGTGISTGCRSACDANDDGRVDISDAVTQLSTLFTPGAPPLPAPGPECGVDPSMDFLTCWNTNCL